MNISGLEILENISEHVDEKMHKLRAESVLDFCKHHGIPKKTTEAMMRQFLVPGRRIMGIWSADREQLDEFFEIIAKWGADYTPGGHRRLTKTERNRKRKDDLNKSKMGKYRCKRPWSSFG